MLFYGYKFKVANSHRINHQIRVKELRVITETGENLGILPLAEALRVAEERGLDLIEISPNAVPPIAKVTDYGKFQYSENKKQKATKSKVHAVEIKGIQVKIGTGDNDLQMKAKKAAEWIKEGHRVKIELFLIGRSKYMEMNFLKERAFRILKFITEPYTIVEDAKKSPKGLTFVIEKKR